MNSFNISDVNSEIANLIHEATTSYTNVDGDIFNTVDTKILTLMIEKQFGEKFNVFFD
jgi:hypothetical protein